MRAWNAGQWMALGFVAAFLLALLAGIADDAARSAEVVRGTGLVRAAAGFALLAFALAVHRSLSPEPVSGVLLALGVFATAVVLAGLAQASSGFAVGGDGAFTSDRRSDIALMSAVAGASVLPLRRTTMAPAYAWKASLAIASVGALSALAAAWVPEVLVLGGLATSLWMFSASFFAWQAARVNVRPGARQGWALAR